MSLTVADLDDLLARMIAAGLSHLSYTDGRASISMRLDPASAVPLSAAPAPAVAEPETISTASMGRLVFAHPGRPEDVAAEGLTMGAGQAVAYVVSGQAITAVVAEKPGSLGRRLREEGDIVGYGTPVFEFVAHG
jgi:acetyl-CoA carboxylase biotin carboxyl carrier protein